jgi:hypothetical protein
MSNSSLLIIASGACALLGVALGLFAYHVRKTTKAFLQQAIRLPATVVEMIPSGADGDLAPKFSFKDPSGKVHTILSRVSTYPARVSVGQSIEVLFNPKTEEGRIAGWIDIRAEENILAFLAVSCLVAGLVCLYFYFS